MFQICFVSTLDTLQTRPLRQILLFFRSNVLAVQKLQIDIQSHSQARTHKRALTSAQLVGRENASPAFFENQKSVLDFERKALIVFIFGINSLSKM